MNGSEINKILNGLYSGGVGLAAGLIDKSDKNKPKEYYDKERKYLADTYQGSIDAANNILNPPPVQQTPMQDPVTEGRRPPVTDPTQSGIPGGEQPTDPVQTKQPLNINDLYARRESAIMDLQGMKYGAPYAESLNRLYKDTLDPQSDWEIKEGKDGQFVAINKKTFETKNITEPIAKEKEFSTKGWDIFLDESGKPYYGERVNKNGTVEIEFRDNLNAQELKDYQYDEDLKSKKLAPPVRSGTRGNSGPKPVKVSTYQAKQLNKMVKEYADLKIKDWDNMTVEEQTAYENLNGNIGRMTGLNADDFTNEVVNSSDMDQAIDNFSAQSGNIESQLNEIKNQYVSGTYDNHDLEMQTWNWLKGLVSTGVSQAVIDNYMRDFGTFLDEQKPKITP